MLQPHPPTRHPAQMVTQSVETKLERFVRIEPEQDEGTEETEEREREMEQEFETVVKFV